MLSLSIAGCCTDCFVAGDEVEHPPWFDGRVYLPLEVGNNWVYNINGADTNTFFVSVQDTVMWRSDTLFTIASALDGPFRSPEFTRFNGEYRISSDTLYWTTLAILDTIKSQNVSPYLHLRILNPLRVGDSLIFNYGTVYGHDPNWGTYRWKITRNDTSITTPFGVFDSCLALEYWFYYLMDDQEYLLAEEFYAPDTGLVHFVEHLYDMAPGDLGDSTVTYDLIQTQIFR